MLARAINIDLCWLCSSTRSIYMTTCSFSVRITYLSVTYHFCTMLQCAQVCLQMIEENPQTLTKYKGKLVQIFSIQILLLHFTTWQQKCGRFVLENQDAFQQKLMQRLSFFLKNIFHYSPQLSIQSLQDQGLTSHIPFLLVFGGLVFFFPSGKQNSQC